MAILESDIKLVESQRMEDTVDGGGRITGNEIIDGAHNSMFPDISDLDRAYGRVNMAKTFLHVKSPDNNKYFGSNVAVLRPPADPSVSVTLMTTRDHYDTRDAARDRLERYLARSVEWQGKLYGDQLQGQRTIRFYQRVGVRKPNVGEVLVLVGDEGLQTEFEQYVRVINSTSTVQKFQVVGYSGEFEREVVVAEISEPLRYKFAGYDVSPYDTSAGRVQLRETIVADAAKYYGIQSIAEDIDFAAMTIRANGIYSQLVPSSRTETPMVDLNAVGEVSTLVESGGVVTFSTSLLVAPGEILYTGMSVTAGSLSIQSDSTTLTDGGEGDLLLGSTTVGVIDYERGMVTAGPSCPNLGTSTKTVEFKPASVSGMVVQSDNDPISEETRGYAYTKTLSPIPGPGSLVISYMVQGKWYSLRDGGKGILRGADESYGSGQLDFTTGSLQLTLGALPDVGSVILYQWGSPVNVVDRKADAASGKLWFEYDFPVGKVIKEGSVVVTMPFSQGVIYESPASGGEIIRTPTGIRFRPDYLPSETNPFTISWEEQPAERVSDDSNGTFRPLDGGTYITHTVAGGNLEPGSITMNFKVAVSGYPGAEPSRPTLLQSQSSVVIEDPDGDGKLYVMHMNSKRAEIGTVNYATGELNITKSCSVLAMTQTWAGYDYWSPAKKPFQSLHDWIAVRQRLTSYHISGRSHQWVAGSIDVGSGICRIQYAKNKGVDVAATSASFSPDELFFEMFLQSDEVVVNNSIRFAIGNRVYVEREGSLYFDIDPATGSGTLGGSLDLANNRVVINNWPKASITSLTVHSFSTILGGATLGQLTTFRTPGAPIAPGSMYLSVMRDGVKYDVTAELDGTINTVEFEGFVNYETGVVDVRFIARPMDLATLKFNCVVYNHLPLDAELIGLDPVRLPTDGRVPIFQKGDVVVIHQTDTKPVVGATAGQVISTGVVRLAELDLLDANGAKIGDSAYTKDLDAGTATMGPAFATQDVTVVYRYEDLVLLIDVDISGVMRLAKPASHAYQANKAYVSSVCIAGDLWSRYSNMFDQQTWLGVWSDYAQGNTVSAQFNDADFPMVLDNQGAITERWYIEFISTTSFKLIGEHVGQIAVGNTSTDFAPTNPNTGKPYFTLPHLGWGSGWATGNVLRFNTYGAIFPFWTIRTILQNDAVIENDAFALQLRGNVNKD